MRVSQMATFKAFDSLNSLCKSQFKDHLLVKQLTPFLSQQIWTQEDRRFILNTLSEALLCHELTSEIAKRFSPILLDLLNRHKNEHKLRQQLFIAVSDLIGYYSDATHFGYDCFQRRLFSPISLLKACNNEDQELRLIKSVFNYLHFNPLWFRNCIDWTFIMDYISHSNIDMKYISIECYIILFALNCSDFEPFIRHEFTVEEETQLKLKYLQIYSPRILRADMTSTFYYDESEAQESKTQVSNTIQSFSDNDFCDNIVSVFGILINRFKSLSLNELNNLSDKYNIVLMPSTKKSLRLLALAVSYGKPILIEGPVGCGKTMLIEYMASLTGRFEAPQLIKIQMGDQIDSKILIGSHICTDIPGEFIWKAGPLTQAMTDGNWLLLEDIDCAPSDVIAMLSSVLEAKSLSSLPGCENTLDRVHSEFRVFFTRRLMTAHYNDGKHSEFSIKSSNHYNSINKISYTISLDLLSREELSTLISSKWSNLSSLKTRILDIYFHLQTDNLENFGSKRLVSLRDLVKWCNRISKNFKLDSEESAVSTFLDASDCFLQCLSSSVRNERAEVIAYNLNISKAESLYLCAKRKPEFLSNNKCIKIGRQSLSRSRKSQSTLCVRPTISSFAFTHQSLSLLEKILVAIDNNEPVLLCGETGTGKTSSVQYLAHHLDKTLTVVNMNQQSDSCDLLGGYKPIEMRALIQPLRNEYLDLFSKTFESEKNATFMTKFAQKFNSQDWNTLFQVMLHVFQKAINKCKDSEDLKRWNALGNRINHLQSCKLNEKGCLAFSFIEGSLVKAMKSGHWILLDEINLAESETLQCLSAILDSRDGSIMLLDKADGLPVERHPEFRLFACMNPATDIGKRELPLGIRNRFTEFFVDELEDKSDLRTLIHSYIGNYVSPNLIESIVDFYLKIRNDSKQILTDATGSRPVYSLRTLCRALSVAATNPCGVALRSLYESFCLSFLTQLDKSSRLKVENDIIKALFNKKDSSALLKAQIEMQNTKDKYECIEGFFILRGSKQPLIDKSYILTPTVNKNLKDICRIISIGKLFPILLQGETSVGKTSLIHWLANATGNVCVRVNNHEHTDLQEYVGTYCADTNGKLVFKEGVLVEAMRLGYWIILDELNLAPTEVLEALNRVLDDNRELFIPETQEVIRAHPKFLLFATQNPAGHYGGRKILSRAFRNRFVELHFDEIPSDELEIILHQRCCLPLSYAKRMVGVLTDLQIRRRVSGVFAGKQGFITLRDLFRWGERYNVFAKNQSKQIKFYDWDLHLANDGYMLLAGRVRRTEEMAIIQTVLESRFKCKLDSNTLFKSTSFLNDFGRDIPIEFRHIVWTKSLTRLGTLLSEALKYNEPVLLVGETGCGKTSICQLFAAMKNTKLYSLNCHMNTESADFLGSLRPVRDFNDNANEQLNRPLFEWIDGPLVNAMKEGSYFLVDEISLADDSVLERLNSVLESERTLLLAENNSSFEGEMSIPVITAKESFRYLATMNPGGDYGKKELSPALRNRFTEIWCPPYEDICDIKDIISHNLNDQWFEFSEEVSKSICDFLQWYNTNVLNSKRFSLSIRDILSWIEFMNRCTQSSNPIPLTLSDAFINGALLVFVDAIGTAGTLNTNVDNLNATRVLCENYLNKLSQSLFGQQLNSNQNYDTILDNDRYFTIKPFCISMGPFIDSNIDSSYTWLSPSVQSNIVRVLRSMQLSKPILLEGVPGVGKTTLVESLAKASGHKLIRINLSEQTDVSDLFGADLPIEGENSVGKFAFRDGPLLQALKSDSTWIILDELNLASQAVLEGLNACLDHRSELFIPELNKTFKISKKNTRIFACQNPFGQGGARKGLPRSFLNRFTSVYFQNLLTEDYNFILSNMFPNVQNSIIAKMVAFNQLVINEVVIDKKFGQRGTPWEFNLRELIRWCQLMIKNISDFSQVKPEKFLKLLYINKMRTIEDQMKMKSICEKYFPQLNSESNSIKFKITENYLQSGYSFLKRSKTISNESNNYNILQSHKECLESLMKCIEMNWMSILIGDSGVGKTTVVRLLAELTGHPLRIFAVNSEMDTMDLLGGFEQKDLSHHLRSLEDSIIEFCSKQFRKCFAQKHIITDILNLWFRIQTCNSVSDSSADKLDLLYIIVEKLSNFNHIETQVITNFKQQINYLKTCQQNKVSFTGAFEWRDSILIRALTHGEWLLIDNANICSASVLDRLNGLLEPNGVLTISEKGSVNGQITTIKPHSQFRLFLTMDPKNGELSRAMRNRGVEINMFAITLKSDLLKQLNGMGINGEHICQFFVNCFENIAKQSIEKLNFANFVEIIRNFIFRIQHGFQPSEALKELFIKFNSHSMNSEEVFIETQTILDSFKFNNHQLENKLHLSHFKGDPSTSCATQDCHVIDLYKESELELRSSAIKVFLESSSAKDSSVRNLIFANYSLHKNFIIESNLFEQTFNNIEDLVTQNTYKNILHEYPIDLRNDFNIWELFWNINANPNNKMELMEKYLNRYLINLFWTQLKYHQKEMSETESNDFVSVIKIASDLMNNKISRNSFPKVFVAIFNVINDIESKLMKSCLSLCPTNDDLIALRDMILWIHQLFVICQQNVSKVELSNAFIIEKFLVLWITTNEKSLSVLQSFLDIDINSSISVVNELLQIETFEFNKKKQTLLLSLTNNCLVFKTEDSSSLFISYIKLCNDLMIANNKRKLSTFKEYLILIAKNIWTLISDDYNSFEIKKDLSLIEKSIQEELKMKYTEMSDDINFNDIINKRSSMATYQMEPLFQLSFYSLELFYLTNNCSKPNDIFEYYLSLIESKLLSLDPLHIACLFAVQNDYTISSDHILYNLMDFNQSLSISNILNCFTYDCNDSKSDNKIITDQRFLQLTTECLPFISLSCSYLLSNKYNSIGFVCQKQTQLLRLKQFLTLNLEVISDSQTSLISSLQFEFVKKWFSKLVQNITVNSPQKNKCSLSIETDCFNQLFNSVSQLINQRKDVMDQSIVSILVGLITAHLLSPTYPIDPIERSKCKLNHYITDLKLIQCELDVRNAIYIMQNGLPLSQTCDHPILQELIKRKQHLKQKIKKLQTNLTFRSSTAQYYRLRSDVKQFLETVINRKTIESYSQEFISLYRDRNSSENLRKRLVEKSLNLINTVSSFIKQMQSCYSLYQDLVNVFLIGVSILLQGLKSATFCLQSVCFISYELKLDSSELTTMFETMGSFFNANSPSFVANYLCDNQTVSKISILSHVSRLDNKLITSSLLRSALLEIQNEMILNQNSNSLMTIAFRILKVFVKSWQHFREVEEDKRLQEEALFEYRTKSHASEPSEEEKDKSELERLFPTYEEEYNDIIDEFSNETNTKLDLIEIDFEKDLVSKIIRSHLEIIESFNRNNSGITITPDFKKSYILRHFVLSEIIKSCGISLGLSIDSALIDGQLIVTNNMLSNINDSYILDSFNIYHQSSIYETGLCFKLLQQLEDKIVNELLPQFENHPTLTKLLKIINRIFDLDLKAPLIKFATGLEVLLQAAQDWQLIAHKGISLVNNLNEITQLVINWRKLELKYWSQCLDSINKKIEEKQTTQWWFHFFVTITAILEQNSSANPSKGSQNQNNEIKQFISSTKQFIEESKLGEFKVRLNLLRTFMFHVKYVEKNSWNNYLFISLQNLYNFYTQFDSIIENALLNERNPIEKEVKDFVKIAKWNDNNFWSVKSAVEKSHKQLYKYMKKYESSLNKTVKTLFSIENDENNGQSSDWKLDLIASKIFRKQSFSSEPIDFLPENYRLLQKCLLFSKKSKLFAKKSITKSAIIVNRINAIESFSTEIIVGVKELSELQVSADVKDKVKWKRSAHHIHNRKRRALSELLKTLTQVGLSYRKGLIIFDNLDMNDVIMTSGPIDNCAKQNGQLFDQFERDLQSCNRYFYKCMARFSSLQIALESPNKELPFGTIERIKGFSSHLMQIVVNRRKIISDNLYIYNKIVSIHQNLINLSKTNESNLIIPENEFQNYCSSAQNFIVRLNAFLHRSKDVFNSMSTSIEEPIIMLSIEKKSNPSHQMVLELNQSIDSFICKLSVLTNKLKALDSEENSIHSLKDMNVLKEVYICLLSLIEEMKLIFINESSYTFNPTKRLFSNFYNEIITLKTEFDNLRDNYLKNLDNFNTFEDLENAIHSNAKQSTKVIRIMLSSVEKVYKYLIDLKEVENSEEIIASLKDSISLTDLKHILNDFDVKNFYIFITKLFKSFKAQIKLHENMENNSSILKFRAQILTTISPLVEIYVKFFQYFLTISVSSLRTSNKLLYILLCLFSQLCQKGFCLPQELSDEIDNKDSESQLKDIEDGGFGEGEGNKDVSNKIESEDQLEDAFKDGLKPDKSEENDDKNIDEEENGIEMENDFDGQTFSPSAKEKENDEKGEESDEDESEKELEDQMGDVDNNSDVLDEKIWGSDDDIGSDESEDEDDTGFAGKDNIDSKLVANDDNKGLQKDRDNREEFENENESDIEINEAENELQNDEYKDERIDQFKQNEKPNEKSVEDLPENMELDDDNDDKDDNCEDVENMSVSAESLSDEEKQSEIEEQNLETETNDEEFDEKTMDEMNTQEIEDSVKENELEENDIQNKETEMSSNLNTDPENCFANDDMNSNTNKETLESNTDCNNLNKMNAEENVEQHGSADAVTGDNLTEGDGGKLQTSTLLHQKQEMSQQMQLNNNKDKSRRNLAESFDKNAKRQRVLENEDKQVVNNNQNTNNSENESKDSKLYRHVDNEMLANDKVYDIASNEDKHNQKDLNDENENNDDLHLDESQDIKTEEKNEPTNEMKSIELKSQNHKPMESNNNKSKSNNDETECNEMEIDGEIVSTMTVKRGNESTFHTAIDLKETTEMNEKMNLTVERLDEISSVKLSIDFDVNLVINAWKECEAKVGPLVYELCEQLQLILEPTKTAKMKGDYRNGKRLNMRKVIAYIASDFRKDKIWLRRTKPSKRQYQIVIAVDDSLSMADNQSKQLAFESLALLGKSLSLLEAGELAIMSFGEGVQLLHSFNEQFTDNTGAKLLYEFTFKQNQTRIAELLQTVISLMSYSQRNTNQQNRDISQLLIIVSDGRGIFSEGEDIVRQSIRKMKDMGIFMVFLVMDNPINKDSILDIRVPIFDNSGKVKIESYMEKFPFPFYIILRDINAMPVIMGEALRQWFELITNCQR